MWKRGKGWKDRGEERRKTLKERITREKTVEKIK